MLSVQRFLDAGFPVLFVATHDESRLTNEINQLPYSRYEYSATQELIDSNGNSQECSFADAFSLAATNDNTVVIVRDLQQVIRNAPIYRRLLNCALKAKSRGSAIIALAPSWNLPPELQHFAPVIEQPLPTRDELQIPLDMVVTDTGVTLDDQLIPDLLDAAAGLTIAEAENAFALSLVETAGKLDPAIIQREKMRLIATTGYLSVEQPRSIDSIGGLGEFKKYLTNEVLPVARDEQLRVRGILLAGLGGTGKSATARAAGSALQWPILRLDPSACKGSLVGQSEANIRNATKLVEAISPCVLWIDEIDKGVGGMAGSGASDGGTSLGMLNHLLTWLQDHDKPILTIATCNDYAALPSALTRAGRFDERFVVDLPSEPERIEIADVHLERLGCDTSTDELIGQLSKDWTGAEIEQLVKSAARLSARKVTPEIVIEASKSIRPLSVTSKSEVESFRQWSRQTLRSANTIEIKKTLRGRKINAAMAK